MKHSFVLTIIILALAIGNVLSQQTSLSEMLLQEKYPGIINMLKNKPELSDSELLTLAYSYRQTGHPAEAINLIENSAFKKMDDVKKMLSVLYFETGNYENALPLIKSIYDKQPEDYRNFIHYADILAFNKEYIDAIALLKKGFFNDPYNFEINKRLGDYYIKIDSLNDAINHYEILFKTYPENQVVALKLAKLYLNTKEYRKSLNVCDTILIRSPDNEKFLELKGIVYFKVAQYSNAIFVMKRLERLGDNSFTVQRILGISYYKKGKYIDASIYLKKALEWQPVNPVINYYLGASLGMLPVPTDGLPYLEEAIRLLQPPPNVMKNIHLSMANIYYNSADYKLAIQNYKEALKYDPKSVENYLHIATVYDLELKNKKAALKYYKKYVESLPEDLDPKKGRELYAINLKKYANKRITAIKEDIFFDTGNEK